MKGIAAPLAWALPAKPRATLRTVTQGPAASQGERYYYSPYGELEVPFGAHFFDYGERSEREPPAMGKAGRDANGRPASLPGRHEREANAGRDDGDVDRTALVTADPRSGSPTAPMLSHPTPLQQRAFDLLQVPWSV